MSRIALAVLSLVALAAAPATAQNLSTHRGFLLGAHLVGAGVEPENRERENGGGLGLVPVTASAGSVAPRGRRTGH
jgi:hypothetical protein